MQGDTVPNRYRDALGAALPGARGQAESVGRAFDTVMRALVAGAWQSPMADTFHAGCVDAQRSGGRAADRCVDQMVSRHRREPFEVARDDRRARFA